MKIKPAALLMSLLIGIARTASASQVLLSETFTAGTTDGWTNSGGSLTITNDAGIGGNALAIVTTSNNRGATKLFSQPVTLGTGDFISVTMDYRLTFITNVNAGIQFRFADSADSSYSALGINPGSTAASSSWFNRNGSTEGSKWANSFTNDLTAETMTFTVTRTATNTLNYSVSWTGGPTFTKTGSAVTNSSDFTFDSLQIYFSGMKSAGFIVDDITVSSSVQGTSRDLLYNGNFENGDIAWDADGQHTIVTNVKHSGSASLQYTATDTYAGIQIVPVVGGRQYNVGGWIKTDAGLSGTVSIQLDYRDMDAVNVGNVTVGGITVPAGRDWTNISQTVTVPTNAVQMKVLLKTYSRTGLCWYDDLSVIPTNSPADSEVAAPANPPITGTWTPTFEDNFNGTEIDGAKWKLGSASTFINGIAGTRADAFSVANGALTIRATLEPVEFGAINYDFSAGELTTYKNFRQQYGYFEARLRYKCVMGMFPAFWTMPDRGLYGDQTLNYKSLIKFNLSSYSSPVTNALLKLRLDSIQTPSNAMMNIYPLSDSWSEYTVTWSNMPVVNPLWLIHESTITNAVGTDLVYDLTDYVNQQIAGDKTVSLALFDTFSRAAKITFCSRESAIAASRPQLILNGAAVEASEDASVRGGSYSDSNYGSSSVLTIKEAFQAGNCSTYITTNAYGTVENGMEMDIMEDTGESGAYSVHGGMHWNGYATGHPHTNYWYESPAFTVEEYHTYGMYWENGRIEYYLDGVQMMSFVTNRVCSAPSYIFLSLQMGGWGANEDPANFRDYDYPATMDVDYVKVWSGTKQ